MFQKNRFTGFKKLETFLHFQSLPVIALADFIPSFWLGHENSSRSYIGWWKVFIHNTFLLYCFFIHNATLYGSLIYPSRCQNDWWSCCLKNIWKLGSIDLWTREQQKALWTWLHYTPGGSKRLEFVWSIYLKKELVKSNF